MRTHEDRIRSYFAACSSGSKDEVARHFTEDAVIYDTNHAPIVSAENIGNFWVQIHAKWTGANWVVERVVEDEKVDLAEAGEDQCLVRPVPGRAEERKRRAVALGGAVGLPKHEKGVGEFP